MDKFNQFFNQYNNQSVEAEDLTALDQCMDLAFKYCDLLGIDRAAIRHQYAYQVWSQPNATTTKYFDMFPNTATFIPNTGDVAVFKIVNGIPVGHIDIVGIGSNINDLTSFAQNWDTIHYNHGKDPKTGLLIPYSRTVIHAGYYGVAGFLRPKNQSVGEDVLVSKIQTEVNGGDSPHDKIVKVKQILGV